MPLGDQVNQFATVRGNITELIGPGATALMFSKSLFVISIGSNDLFDLVEFFPNISTSAKVQYLDNLKLTYHNHLKVRKLIFRVLSLGLLKRTYILRQPINIALR